MTTFDQEYHREQAEVAARLYRASLSPADEGLRWTAAKAEGRRLILEAFNATKQLTEIEIALQANGMHTRALRQLLGPPLSQDQFALACPSYVKSAENSGRAYSEDRAAEVAHTFESWRDHALTSWLDRPGAIASPADLAVATEAAATLIASQLHATCRRGVSSSAQEGAVVELLIRNGWRQLPSVMIDRRAALSAREFQKKTRFATKGRPQEVDIACGMGATVVLAMECKVSNDATNSVKRINDVLKKATAWREKWGEFVLPAALLQGVIAYKDVSNLLKADIEVFWSHDLPRFETWIDNHLDA